MAATRYTVVESGLNKKSKLPYRGGFSEESARRTRHANRNAARRRHRETTEELDLPGLGAVCG